MLPNFLLPDQVIRENGCGPAIHIGDSAESVLSVTLGINRIIEQESLDLAIWTSSDGESWGDKPVAAFPQKFYCGVYTLMVDLTSRPDARFVRAAWKLSRWGRGEPTPLFGVYVFAEQVHESMLKVAV